MIALFAENAQADDGNGKTYTYTFSSNPFSSSTSANLQSSDGTYNATAEWELTTKTSQSAEVTYNSGLKFGSNSKAFSSVKLSTSSINGQISSVKITTYGNSSIIATVAVSVNGINYKNSTNSETSSLTSSSDAYYTFTGTESGKIVITWAIQNSKAFYVKAIEITYDESAASKTNTIVSFGDEANVSYSFEKSSTTDITNFEAPTATVKDASSNAIEGATVKYASSNTELATVDESTGKVTIMEGKTGTATITATYEGNDTYNKSSASYTITVLDVVENFADFMNTTTATKVMLTEAQVLYVNGTSDMFVRDAAGTCIDLYKSGLSFTAGDVISGSFIATYKFYNNLGPEATDISGSSLATSSNSTPKPKIIASTEVKDHLCDLVKLEGAEVTKSSSKYYVGDVQIYDKFGLGYSLTENSNYNLEGIAVVYGGTTYEICPTKTPTEVGETEITLSQTSLAYTTENYTTFAAPTVTVSVSDTKVEIEGAAVTYASGNTEVATVTDNEVSLTGKAGKAKITVTYAGETGKYKSSTATYTIKVTEPGIEFTFEQTSKSEGNLSNAPEGVTAAFNNTYTGNKFQLTEGKSMTLTLSNLPIGYKVEGITLNVANNKSGGAGTAKATVGKSGIADELSITGFGSDYIDTDIENVNCPVFTSESNSLTITISATENSVWCTKFIIKLVPTEEATTTELASSETGWGTVCLPYTAQTVKGTSLYTVAGSSDKGIVVEEKADGILVAGTPYIFKAESNGTFYKASNTGVENPVAGENNLVGVLTASQLTGDAVDGIYILPKDGVWHQMGKGVTVNLTQNRAYLTSLPAAVSSEVKGNFSVIGTDEATAINGVDADLNVHAADGIYTIAGQRVKAITKGGIYIVNGKKVLVK